MAKIKNLHYTICLNVFSSSGHVALPKAFAQLGVHTTTHVKAHPRPVDMPWTKTIEETRFPLAASFTAIFHMILNLSLIVGI